VTWEDIQGGKYDSIDRCIYCGSDGSSGGLRDEQIVPYSLGGLVALRRASRAPARPSPVASSCISYGRLWAV